MISAALALAATLASLFAWWFRRREDRQDLPENRHEQQRQNIDQAIVAGAEGTEAINRLVERSLDLRLRQSSPGRGGDTGGPRNPIPPGGSTAHPSSEPLSGSPGANAGNPSSPLGESGQ